MHTQHLEEIESKNSHKKQLLEEISWRDPKREYRKGLDTRMAAFQNYGLIRIIVLL